MPLIHSDKKEDVSKNIATLMKEGKKHAQAIAIALDIQRRTAAKKKAKKKPD